MTNLKRNDITDDPYKVLNLLHTASDTEIKASYRQLAKKYHPDTWSAPCFSDSEKQHATVVFQKISAAYDILSDVNKKAEYDRNYKLGLYTHKRPEEKPFRNSSSNNNNNGTRNTKPSPPVKPPQMGAPPPLPNGWTTAIDPVSGSQYYYHVASGRSSWTHPLFMTYGNKKNTDPKRKFTRNSRGYDDSDGIYYDYSDMYDHNKTTQSSDYSPPDAHRCGAFLALFLCPPFGILACYHSIMVNRCWNQMIRKSNNDNNNEPRRRKSENDTLRRRAAYHSNKAATYVCFGNTLGILFLVYFLLFRNREGANDHEWMRDWKKKDWWPFDD